MGTWPAKKTSSTKSIVILPWQLAQVAMAHLCSPHVLKRGVDF